MSQKYLTYLFHVKKMSLWSKYSGIKNKLLYFSEVFFLCILFRTVKTERFGKKINRMYRLLVFTHQQRSQCMTWFHLTNSITQTQRSHRARYFERPPARNAIILWVEKFNKYGSLDIMLRSERPPKRVEHEKNVPNYFSRYLTWSIQRAKTDLQISHSIVQRIMQERIQMFLNQLSLF